MLPFSYAAAEGFQVNAQSTKQAGMGHVGVAMKLGAESMHFNPAGLVFMDKNVDLSAGVSGVFATAEFQKDNYSFETDNTPSTPLYVYAGFKSYDNLAAGVMINTPYGSSITWGHDWAGAHLMLVDAPGHVDFSAEAERTLAALERAFQRGAPEDLERGGM